MAQTVLTEVPAGDSNAFRIAALTIDDAKWIAIKTEGNVTFIISKT